MGPQRQVLGAFSADLADNEPRTRLDRTAGQCRRGAAAGRHGCGPTSPARGCSRGNTLVQRPTEGDDRTPRHRHRSPPIPNSCIRRPTIQLAFTVPGPYPDYPPFDITPLDTDFGLAGPFGLGFGVGFLVVRPLWRWCSFDWAQRRIQLDVDRFNALNRHRPGTATSTWRRDPSRLSLTSRDFTSRAPIQVLHGSAIPAAMISRLGVPRTAGSVPTERRSWVPPAFTPVGRAPTAVLRSAPRSFAFAGRGLQARSEWRSGLASRWIMPPTMPQHFAPATIPRTVARSTPSALGGGGHFGGASRR